MDKPALKMWTNNTDFVVAATVEEAQAICTKTYGFTDVETFLVDMPDAWSEMPEKVFGVYEDLDEEMRIECLALKEGEASHRWGEAIPDVPVVYMVNGDGGINRKLVRKLVSEWCASEEPGHLSSTEE